ncbi:unnamed protein product [Meloidogyne enterolobii]|uniref:Uncharacterized protein n=1 Tax=Meloidogyne enterolobii TaxID=390850 RepID=A0ACB0YML1_MELEN
MVGGRRIPGKNNFCGRNWCVYDACGIVCGLFTWLLLSYGQFCILAIMMTSFEDNKIHQSINFLIFEILFVLSGAAHLKTMFSFSKNLFKKIKKRFTDPGAVPKGTLTEEYIAQLEKEQQFNGTVLYKCTKCSSIKPERAHHCSVCKRCIRSLFNLFLNYLTSQKSNSVPNFV